MNVMEARRRWLADRGIGFIVMVGPNKQSIYPENLPRGWTMPWPTAASWSARRRSLTNGTLPRGNDIHLGCNARKPRVVVPACAVPISSGPLRHQGPICGANPLRDPPDAFRSSPGNGHRHI